MDRAMVAALALVLCFTWASAHNVTVCSWSAHGDCRLDEFNVSHRLSWAHERFDCTHPPANTTEGWWTEVQSEHEHRRRLLDMHAGHDHSGMDMGANMGWDCDATRLAAGCMDVKVLHDMAEHTMYMNVCMPAVMAAPNNSAGAQMWFDSVAAYSGCLENSTDCASEEVDSWRVGLMAEDPEAGNADDVTKYIDEMSGMCRNASTADQCAVASEQAKLVAPPVPAPFAAQASNSSAPPLSSPPATSATSGRSWAVVCILTAALLALCL